MARPSNTAARRKQISAALLQVMAEHGYHRASIAKIAAEAELASGLVHYHFESKKDILIDAVETLVAAFEQRYQQHLERAYAARARIYAFVDAHLALGDDADASTVAAWVVIGAQAVQDDDVREVYAGSVERRLRELEQLIRADSKERGVSGKGSRAVAAALMSAIEGCYLLSAAAPGVMPTGYAAPAVRSMVEGLLV